MIVNKTSHVENSCKIKEIPSFYSVFVNNDYDKRISFT